MNITKIGAALFRMDIAMMGEALKAKWMEKTFPFGADYRDEAARFDRLYMLRDPWSLNCESEMVPLQTNQQIDPGEIRPRSQPTRNWLRRGSSIQSFAGGMRSPLRHRCKRARRPTGQAPVSSRHIRRRRYVCLPQRFPPPRFDLVIACEVLYYMSDIPRALRRLSELGRTCVISYYDGAREVLDKHVQGTAGHAV